MSRSSDALHQAGTLLRMVRALDHDLRQAGTLSLTEMSVLRQIEHGCDHPSGIARELRLDPARITRISDRLVAERWVERVPDPEDRRRLRLVLTESGAEALHRGQQSLLAGMNEMLCTLSPEEQQALATGLEAVRRGLGYGGETGAINESPHE